MVDNEMRVGFSDPEGPRSWRTVPYVLSILLLLFAVIGPIPGWIAALPALAAVGLLNFSRLFRKGSIRNAELEIGAGYIDVRGSGSRNQRIRVSDIHGATTARTSSGLLLTMHHRWRDQPITLELASHADADRVRHALGIGHSGVGTIAWQTGTDSSVALVGRLLVVAAAVLMAAIVMLGAGLTTFFLSLFLVAGTIIGLTNANRTSVTVVMGPLGLYLQTSAGWFALPYDAILHVEEAEDRLVFSVSEMSTLVTVPCASPLFGGPSKSDRQVLVLQIRAAVERATGKGTPKQDVTGRIDILRRNGASSRDWIARLDMVSRMLSSSSGYRGSALDQNDLWTVLEDPESDPDLRFAATRVLRHTPNSYVRIATAVSAVREDSTHQRLRIALEQDVDEASEKLAIFDASSAHLSNARAVRGPP